MPAEGTGLPAIGDEIAGKYRVESVLGQGGMGAVYAARNMLTGKRVAIKWLLPEHAASVTRDRLLREAQIASSIDHPNVVDIYDVGEHQGGLFLVMEYLRGRPLSDVLAERGRLDPDELIALLVPAMRGVHAAHLAGVIHRDLKPENIILSESDGQIVPKVLDFGVSKTNGASAVPASSLTRTGALVGTPHYMALEQVDGSNAIDTRTDVYAFGVLLYRALTGHFPFDGSTLGEVILKIGTKEAVPLRMLRPELPPGLDTVVLRALARDRHKRFKDLEEFARALMPFTQRGKADLSSSQLTPGAISFRSLGLPSMSGTSSQDGLTVAQATAPAGALGRRRNVLIAAAAIAVLLLIAGVMSVRRQGTENVATGEGGASTARTAASLPVVEQAPKTAPVAPQPTPVVLAIETSQEAAAPAAGVLGEGAGHAGAGAPSLDLPREAAPDALAPQAADAVLRERAKNQPSTLRPAPKATKHAREVAPAKKAGAALIPGERTNGLSVDEF